MMITNTPRTAATRPPTAVDLAWIAWRSDVPSQPDRLSVAELAECHCPDLCDRDHANE
jgi:hypothetical protein